MTDFRAFMQGQSKPKMLGRKDAAIAVRVAGMLVLASVLSAETPKPEERRKEQLLRLAQPYDLAKYTITREMVIERGAIKHSSPVLTLNLRSGDGELKSSYFHIAVACWSGRLWRNWLPRAGAPGNRMEAEGSLPRHLCAGSESASVGGKCFESQRSER